MIPISNDFTSVDKRNEDRNSLFIHFAIQELKELKDQYHSFAVVI